MNITPAIADVDVVIPLYNGRAYIVEAILSVLQQSLLPRKLIVVDDGSTDGSAEFAEEFLRLAATPVDLQLIRQANAGPNAARNTGTRSATSTYVAFLDADDTWLPQKLEKQMELFQRSGPEVVMIYCPAFTIDSEGHVIEDGRMSQPLLKGRIFDRLLMKNTLGGGSSAVVIKRTAIEEAGFFDEGLRTSEDHDMWLRIARVGNVEAVDEPLVGIRVHGSSATRNAFHMLKGLLQFDQKWFEHARGKKEVLEYWGHLLALFAARCTDRKQATELIRRSLTEEQRRSLFSKTFGSVELYVWLKRLRQNPARN
jgi:glycosyltransferase involved in cell wall biosynthesis